MSDDNKTKFFLFIIGSLGLLSLMTIVDVMTSDKTLSEIKQSNQISSRGVK